MTGLPGKIVATLIVLGGAVSGQEYRISTIAGGGFSPGGALDTNVGNITGVTADNSGNIYFSSSLNVVYKLDASGNLARVAGNGTAGYSGDNGPATSAELDFPEGLAVDGSGNLYIADSYNGLIRKVTAEGVITTAVGCCLTTSAHLSSPQVVAIDSSGTLYAGDEGHIYKLPPGGKLMTVAAIGSPTGLAVDAGGNLFVASVVQILKISVDGTETVFAGNGQFGHAGDGGPALDATFGFIAGLAFDAGGDLLVDDGSIRKISTDGTVRTVADATCCSPPDGSIVNGLSGDLGVDPAGNSYVGVFEAGVLRKITPNGVVTNVAGNPNADSVGDGGPATDAQLSTPEDVAVDASGNIYIADYGDSRVRKVSPSGVITTIAGTGISGFSGDGGLANNAQLAGPVGVAVDSAGNLFISEYLNNRVRKVTPAGVITTVAGGGCCYPGDNGPAVDAELAMPHGIAVDPEGNLYIADSLYGRVRKVAPDGIITTIAGTGVRGFSGDGGPATQAQLNLPWGVAADAFGDVFVADNQALRVRKISANGIITTIAGPSLPGGSASNVMGVAVDASSNVFFAGAWIWRVAPDGAVSEVSVCQYCGSVSKITGNGMAIDSHDRILVVNGNAVQMLERPLLEHP